MTRLAQRPLLTLATILAFSSAAVLPTDAIAGNPTVLGLESDEEASTIATELTDALRRALVDRGFEPGAEMSLLELNLTLNCEDEDFACLAEGGKNLDASEIVYGSIVQNGQTEILTLTRIDVESQELLSTLRLPLQRNEIEQNVDAVAKDLIAQLWKDDDAAGDTAAAAAADGDDTGDDDDAEATPKSDDRDWEWGKDPNPPAWKWAGVGVSAGLAAASLGTAIATSLMVTGGVRDDLLSEADASLDDDNPNNDIDRQQLIDDGIDLCSYAREETDPENEPGAVRNANVTKICNRGNALATTATAGWIASGVFVVSTAVFTTLMFTRKKNKTAATLHRHGFAIGGAPLAGGGMMVGGRLRF